VNSPGCFAHVPNSLPKDGGELKRSGETFSPAFNTGKGNFRLRKGSRWQQSQANYIKVVLITLKNLKK